MLVPAPPRRRAEEMQLWLSLPGELGTCRMQACLPLLCFHSPLTGHD